MKLLWMQGVAAAVLMSLMPLSASAAKSTSLYLDGALVELQDGARKGYVEISLPPGAAPESLRIKPESGVTIIKVITAPQKPAAAVAKELTSLADREEQLHDRMKALTVREEIFKSAAKSQSAKAPRRTRTNPEPLSTIRQGTDYAITQLESVYQAKRRAEKELAQLGERRKRLQKDESGGGTLAKVWVTPASGKVTASWLQSDRNWVPSYQLRATTGGEADLALHAGCVMLAKGESATIRLSNVTSAHSPGYVYGGEALPVKKLAVKLTTLQGGTHQAPLVLTMVNASDINLPAGEVACYQNGSYMGKGLFSGADTGKSVEIICNGR